MNLYEEFGLPPSATAEELKKARKAWARLLHPDKIRDTTARGLAESRMKRINEIYSLLSDPARRSSYDESLARPCLPAVREPSPAATNRLAPWIGLARRNAAWSIGTLACVLLIYWLLSAHSGVQTLTASGASEPAPTPPPAIQSQSRPAPAKSPAKPLAPRPRERERAAPNRDDIELLAREMREMRQRLDAALIERDRVPAAHPAVTAALPPAPAITPPDPASITPPTAVHAPQAPPPTTSKGLAGTWVYVPPPSSGGAGAYPAEYIELVIVERGGALAGRYRGRYRIADRALSPEVRFSFEGPRGSTFAWSGNGGSRGKVELMLLSEHTVSVTWYTSELGQQPALTSGTATLIRRLDP